MRLLALALPLLLIASQAGAAEPLAATIQTANRAFAAAFNKGDTAALAQMYTEQATILPSGAEMAQGRPAIQKFWQAASASGLKNMVLTVASVEPLGATALREIGRFSFDTPSGKAEGKYLVVWKKPAGKWLLDADIWNMNK